MNNAGQGVVHSAPLDRYLFARLEVPEYLFRCGHVWFASLGHVSCEDGYDPADLGNRAGLKEK